MDERFKRMSGIINDAQFEAIKSTTMVLFGLGGVGGFAFEAIIRAGFENLALIDMDKFEITNLNRQLASNSNNIGLYKVDVYKNRATWINPNANILTSNVKVSNENINSIFDEIKSKFSNSKIFVLDMIDDVNAKIEIIKYCHFNNLELISSMGTANHINSDKIYIDKINNTSYCPLAKKIRHILNDDKNINPTVLYFKEEPIKALDDNNNHLKSTISYIPAISGLKIAEYCIKKII